MKALAVHMRLIIALLALSLMSFRVPAVTPQLEAEHAIKTAIVFKLLRFVSWPESDWEGSKTLNVCLTRRESYYPAFKEIEGAAIGERSLKIVLMSKRGNQKCHAVFASSKTGLSPQQWRPLAKQAVLTISDSDNFARHGGMINLVTRDNRVSFGVNVQAVEAANLQVSALVLKLAEIVESDAELVQIGEPVDTGS